MFIITSIKKNIRAISETNNDIDFHNKLFQTDDCVITWEKDPTPEEIEAQKARAEICRAEAEAKKIEEDKKETMIREKIRSIAIEQLKAEGRLDINEKIIEIT